MPWFCDRLDEIDGVEHIIETYELGDLVRPMNIHEELNQKKKIYRIDEFKVENKKSWEGDKKGTNIGVFWAYEINDPERVKVKFGVEQLKHLSPLERLAAEAPHETFLKDTTGEEVTLVPKCSAQPPIKESRV
jgi:hypothetical protein